MMKIFHLIFLGISFLTLSSFAEEKIYSEEEFKSKVEAEVEKQLKRAGRGQLANLSKELLEKEESLRIREIQVKKLEQQLKITEQDFNKKLTEFTQRQKQFLGCLDQQDKQVNDRVQHMVDVVSGMRPQNAADVLSVQDADISVKILAQLEPDKVSRIFNLMDKEVSARLQKQYMDMKK